MNDVYGKMVDFKKHYPMSISWRLKQHAKIVEKHLNDGEIVLYAFAGQKNDNPFDIITTYAIVLTNKRIILASKRMLFGYFFTSITPDLFNDLKVKMGLIWGKIYIDTMKEFVTVSNIDGNALAEIETNISNFMMNEKQKFNQKQEPIL